MIETNEVSIIKEIYVGNFTILITSKPSNYDIISALELLYPRICRPSLTPSSIAQQFADCIVTSNFGLFFPGGN